ncbi:DUF1206 domain-containing protein [Paenibacillus lutrae]|uniref:DUF1206 domain-containing protein n=1 Tax=Paenibacillus lutrae TaxID=2078573 RepID=A0A7X3FLS3_9BACL|nr:DUF1206 domain-containing protein [Paenibacillus lutrae]MVP02068.1 DUF1206 domain-containing protein [Paenibacillus lutrae]
MDKTFRNKAYHPTKNAVQHGKKAVREKASWIDKLARIGYAAKGTVYSAIGVLALLAAAGYGGEVTDKKGALAAIGSQPLGGLFLFILAVGLTGYLLWCIVQAFVDTDGEGNGWKGIAARIGTLAGGVVYGVLAITAFQTMNHSEQSAGGQEQSMTALLLQKPFGATLVAAAGAAVAGYGLYQIIKAYKVSFTKRFKKNEISAAVYRNAVRISRFGLAARGVVFGLVAFFLIRTAVLSDPSETKGVDEALAELAKQPFGNWLLGAAALGLLAYGLYLFVLARYRKTIAHHR